MHAVVGLLSADSWTNGFWRSPNTSAPAQGRRTSPALLVIGRVAMAAARQVMFRDAEDLWRTCWHHTHRFDGAATSVLSCASQRFGAWQVDLASGVDFGSIPWPRRRNARFLREESATGRLAPRFFAALGDKRLRDRIVNELLLNEFPEELHRHILVEVGLVHHVPLHRSADDLEFRRRVMRATESLRGCADSAFPSETVVQLASRRHTSRCQSGRPVQVDNGLLLCDGHRTVRLGCARH